MQYQTPQMEYMSTAYATTYNLIGTHLYFRDMEGKAHNVLLPSDSHVHVTDVIDTSEREDA